MRLFGGCQMKKTGVFLSPEKYEEVKALLQPKISMDLKTNITITEPGDKVAAWKLIDDFAKANGLPELPDNGHYGLTSDRELVSA
jgi:hypothetical protein